MSVSLLHRIALALGYFLPAASAFPQDLPALPPSIDPSFWGHANKPYALTLTVTSSKVDAKNAPQTHVSELNVFRDSTGRVRTESFYHSGQPSFVALRDPDKSTYTDLGVVKKSVFVVTLPRPMVPPPGKGWIVERLSSRVIDGFPAEGFRFTRAIPASADGKKPANRVIEEDWVSNELDVVLERRVESPLTGTMTETVSHLKTVEPDPTLFTIPSDYALQQGTTTVSP